MTHTVYPNTAAGGCQCGSIRFQTQGQPLFVAYCHCNDCRRANGAPVSTFVGYQLQQITMLVNEPRRYVREEGVQRSFCGQCGTPIAFQADRYPGEIHLHIGAFDTPEQFAPTEHVWCQSQLSWLTIQDDLSRQQSSDPPYGATSSSASQLIFLANIYDPYRADARSHLVPVVGKTPEQVWDEQQIWLQGKTLGAPQKNNVWTAEELKELGFVGVYKLPEDPQSKD